MPQDRRLVAVVALSAVVVAFLTVVAFWNLVRVRTISVDELRAGTSFDNGGVHFHQTSFEDTSYEDGPLRATFRITFPDGAVETLAFQFDCFCAVGTESRTSSMHRAPTAVFTHSCGQNFIGVLVQ